MTALIAGYAIVIALTVWMLQPVIVRGRRARAPVCPNCGPRLEGDARYCSNCGAKLLD